MLLFSARSRKLIRIEGSALDPKSNKKSEDSFLIPNVKQLKISNKDIIFHCIN